MAQNINKKMNAYELLDYIKQNPIPYKEAVKKSYSKAVINLLKQNAIERFIDINPCSEKKHAHSLLTFVKATGKPYFSNLRSSRKVSISTIERCKRILIANGYSVEKI
jgi:hypothetical protein